MSFPIPVRYELTEELNNTRVVYNNGDTLEMIPTERCIDIEDIVNGGSVVWVTVVGFNLFDRSQALENKALIWATGLETTEGDSISSPYIRVIGGKRYYTNYKAGWFVYDAELNYIGAYHTINGWNKASGSAMNYATLPDDAVYLRLAFRTSMNNYIDMTEVEGINVNFYDRSRNGTYEPYVERTKGVII